MDPDTARMLADLGLARRDFVSTQAEDRPRRVAAPIQPRAALATVQAQYNNAQTTTNAGAHHANTLKAWNSATTFERDEVAEQLDNHFNGQGHRAALSVRRQYDELAEAAQARYGEERLRYMQEHDISPSACSSASSAGPASRGPPSHSRHVPTGPFNSSMHVAPDRGRFASISNPSRPRASSPRSRGTVRFLHGQRIVKASPSHSSTTSPKSAPNVPRSAVASSPSTSTTPQQPLVPGISDPLVAQQIVRNKALYYAAHPGEEADLYHKRHPHLVPYLRRARAELVANIISHVKDPYSKELTEYLALRQCSWMLEIARKAKDLVEHSTELQAEAYYSAHPDDQDFYEAAKKNFKPVPKVVVQSPSTASEPTPPPSPVHIIDEIFRSCREQPPIINDDTSSDNSDASSDDSCSTVMREPSSSAPATVSADKGTFRTSFFDAVGDFLESKLMSIGIPAQITVTVKSNEDGFNPRMLVEGFANLAAQMDAMSKGTCGGMKSSQSHGLEGVTLADDGVWEFDD